MLAATLILATPTRVLFLGNSHTAANNLPSMVQSMFPSGTFKADHRSGAFLNDIAKNPEVLKTIKEGKYGYVVLQGAMLSSSHQYRYSQEGAVQLAKAATASGAKAFLFAEWSRKGIQESGYILGIYGDIAKITNATLVPICTSFDKALAVNKGLDLWSADGNHASIQGSYLASLTLYRALGGKKMPTWAPAQISKAEAKLFWSASQVLGRESQRNSG